MEIQELAIAAQSLSFEQRKELIKAIFAQQPKADASAPSVLWVGDLEAGTEEIRNQVRQSIQLSAEQLTERVTKTHGVCGGKACVAGTRVRVMDVVVWHERMGWSADEIVSEIPHITLSDVYAALTYYFDHREEIEEDIRLNDEIAGKLHTQQSSKLPSQLTN
ncbi:MAG: DUF433 domain-containing protein [Blastocatellia bacterium]